MDRWMYGQTNGQWMDGQTVHKNITRWMEGRMKDIEKYKKKDGQKYKLMNEQKW